MKPILFNTEMVKALLDGRKTVTRRVVKPKCKHNFVSTGIDGEPAECRMIDIETQEIVRHVYPPYQPGDILYVRETYGTYSTFNGHSYAYKGDYIDFENSEKAKKLVKRWIPSIHMPREAARIFLRVIGVRVERLQDITVDDVINEGAWGNGEPKLPMSLLWHEHPSAQNNAAAAFAHLWDDTVKPAELPQYGWDANPWVWAIEFERISKEDAYNA